MMALEDASRGLSGCTCEEEDGWWNLENIMQCQMVSDILIAVAYFSIPLELLYFISCSNGFPFRWVVIQFGAFIVVCGLTHLINVWTYGPHSFQIMLAVTIFKLMTALVSCATAITLVTLIPELLRVKVRELFLTRKARDLDREVVIMKKHQEEVWHVGMLTQEIRNSLDQNTILSTTLVELAKTLSLENCMIWMPSAYEADMELTHELKRRILQSPVTVPSVDPDVEMIKGSSKAITLNPDSAMGQVSNQGETLPGPMAGIRVPLLKVANFKGGSPQGLQASYAILVLVLPLEGEPVWTKHALEIVEVVADQVAVALSHAAVLEESQQMRDQLAEQNKPLQQARQDAMMARRARTCFQQVLNHEMRTPMHSISALSSILKAGSMNNEQRAIVHMLAKANSLLSTVVNDIMNYSQLEDANVVLELQPFHLAVMLKEAANLTKHMSKIKGLRYSFDLGDGMPDRVIGDEKRILQIILHMVGNVVRSAKLGTISIRACVEDRAEGKWDLNHTVWRPSLCEGFIYLRFEIKNTGSGVNGIGDSTSAKVAPDPGYSQKHLEAGLGFAICEKFVQLMHGNIWIKPISSQSGGSIVTFLVRLQLQTSTASDNRFPSDGLTFKSALKGLNVIVVDDNNVNRRVTKRLLENLGCQTTVADSGYQCLATLSQPESSIQVVLLDVCMPEMDGYEVAFRIRQKVPPENRPLVVALTASTDKGTRDRCLRIGMDGVIQKPVSLREMSSELLKLIQRTNEH